MAVRYVSLAVIFPLVYGAPIFPIRNKKQWRWYRLKDIPGAKAWIVCTIITYGAIALPLPNLQYKMVLKLSPLQGFQPG